jgi:hypothetical protein
LIQLGGCEVKQAILTAKAMVLLFGLLASVGCGISAPTLMATQAAVVRPTVETEVWQTAEVGIETTVAAMRTSVAATQPAQVTPTGIPSTRVALISFHGRYVTAMGEDDGWVLRQETELSECGRFTQYHLDNGRIALVTCHGRYVTAPRRGTTRWDWELWQESGLGDCGQFTLHDQGSDVIVFETCAGRFVTAGDGNWPGGLAWSLVGETYSIEPWERFTVLPEL